MSFLILKQTFPLPKETERVAYVASHFSCALGCEVSVLAMRSHFKFIFCVYGFNGYNCFPGSPVIDLFNYYIIYDKRYEKCKAWLSSQVMLLQRCLLSVLVKQSFTVCSFRVSESLSCLSERTV